MGATGLVNYAYKDWEQANKSKGGEFFFDSFRIFARSDVTDWFHASAQYRFYEGWRTPHHLWVAADFGHLGRDGKLYIGQTWVPFGIDWQSFDDWGTIAYYVGLQDDYDLGLNLERHFGKFDLNLAFFKNQQLSSSSRERYDADLYSGDCGPDDICSETKENEESNQFNVRTAYNFSMGGGSLELGLSGMWGQIYNRALDVNGDRVAFAGHANLNIGKFHLNAQATRYDYDQELQAGKDEDYLNVSNFNYAYEIPRKATIFSASTAWDFIGERLTGYTNFSLLTGGTSETDSYFWSAGVRTFWPRMDGFLEVYYGKNDPTLSGDASGYGRDVGTKDWRVEGRIFYHIRLSRKTRGPIGG